MNDNLSKYACRNMDALRLNPEKEDSRPPFFMTQTVLYFPIHSQDI